LITGRRGIIAGPIAAVVLGIAALAGAVVAIRIGPATR
jgi:hypothetical protein